MHKLLQLLEERAQKRSPEDEDYLLKWQTDRTSLQYQIFEYLKPLQGGQCRLEYVQTQASTLRFGFFLTQKLTIYFKDPFLQMDLGWLDPQPCGYGDFYGPVVGSSTVWPLNYDGRINLTCEGYSAFFLRKLGENGGHSTWYVALPGGKAVPVDDESLFLVFKTLLRM